MTLLAGKQLVVLTGAGCSTESGIPDYRGGGRPPSRRPILHDSFVRLPEVRQRYWARSTVAWRRFSAATPNAAHAALATLERRGNVRGIITQNVDRLHHGAGSRRVIELHGALATVRCLACDAVEDRDRLQVRLVAANRDWLAVRASARNPLAPDGDADVGGADEAPGEDPADGAEGAGGGEGFHNFRVPTCLACGGTLMPDVVFFGGTVSATKVAAAWSLLEEAEALLVVGSSLAVYSGFRFVRGAADCGLPIAIVNLGTTRGDDLCQIRVEAAAGRLLPVLVERLPPLNSGPALYPDNPSC